MTRKFALCFNAHGPDRTFLKRPITGPTKWTTKMPDWVAVAHLPSYKVRQLLHKWPVEVPKALMLNRQRTLHSFLSAVGARVLAALAQLEKPATVPADAAPAPRANTGEPAGGDAEATERSRGASAARRSEATATPPHARSHDIGAMPLPWGEKPKSRSRVYCAVLSPALTSTGGAPTRRHISAAQRC